MEGGKVAVGGDSDESECYIGKVFTHLKSFVPLQYQLILLLKIKQKYWGTLSNF